jgi:hypothetical protein
MTSKDGFFKVVFRIKMENCSLDNDFCSVYNRSRFQIQFCVKNDFQKAVFRSRFFKKREIANTLIQELLDICWPEMEVGGRCSRFRSVRV